MQNMKLKGFHSRSFNQRKMNKSKQLLKFIKRSLFYLLEVKTANHVNIKLQLTFNFYYFGCLEVNIRHLPKSLILETGLSWGFFLLYSPIDQAEVYSLVGQFGPVFR